MDKSTIYIDIEDDITSIIGKLNEATGKQVRLVAPKRSTVLQSVVNLKLIKKSAAAAGKDVALITEDPAIGQLAARLGILTAPNLSSEPAIPSISSDQPQDLPSDVIEGEALTTAPAGKEVGASDINQIPPPADATPATAPGAVQSAKDNLRKRIPDFSRFKKRFLLVFLGLAGLIFLIWLMLIGLPKARVEIAGHTAPLKAEFSFTADTEAERADYDNDVLPAKVVSIDKTLSDTFNATGKKDVGTKASGTITIRNCDYPTGFSMSSGSRFTSANGQVFASTESVSVPGFTGPASTCDLNGPNAGKATVKVAAIENGSDYNIDAQPYSFKYSSAKVDATGSEMKGGSSEVITVVTQSDVDNARKELLKKEQSDAKKELAGQVDKDKYLIAASLVEKVEEATAEPGVGKEATNARLSLKVKYSQTVVKRSELEELMKHNEKVLAERAEDTKQLGVADAGLEEAEFAVTDRPSSTATRFKVKTEALLGPDIDFEELKQRLGGKKYSEAVDIVKSYPNVSGAEIKFSPFWVRKVPRNPDKVTIEIKIPQ